MTDPHGHHPHDPASGAAHGAHHDVRSEEDRVSTGKIIAVGVGSLLVFLVASVATGMYFRARTAEHGPLPFPADIGKSKIGMVEQQLFELSTRGEADLAGRRRRLGSFGWVDQKAGVVHIPIERAMELVAKGARPSPSGPGTAQPPGGQP